MKSLLIFAAVAALAFCPSCGGGCGGDTGLFGGFGSSPSPDACDVGYLVQGPTADFYEVDPHTGRYTRVLDDYDLGGLNAIGFSTLDHRIYGVAIDEDRADTTTFAIAAIDPSARPIQVDVHYVPVPVALQGVVEFGLYAGDVDTNGRLYITRTGVPGFAVIDVDPTSATYMELLAWRTFSGDGDPGTRADWLFSPIDGQLYSVNWQATGVSGNHESDLWRINPDTGETINLGRTTIAPDRRFGACYVSQSGVSFWSDNDTGEIWALNLSDPTNIDLNAWIESVGPLSSQNDGARCALAN